MWFLATPILREDGTGSRGSTVSSSSTRYRTANSESRPSLCASASSVTIARQSPTAEPTGFLPGRRLGFRRSSRGLDVRSIVLAHNLAWGTQRVRYPRPGLGSSEVRAVALATLSGVRLLTPHLQPPAPARALPLGSPGEGWAKRSPRPLDQGRSAPPGGGCEQGLPRPATSPSPNRRILRRLRPHPLNLPRIPGVVRIQPRPLDRFDCAREMRV